MASEEERGNNEMAKKNEDNASGMNSHKDQKLHLQEQHLRKLDQMSKEHERKLKRDGEKFEQLLEQKEKMIKDWEEKLMQMKVSQKEQVELIYG